MKPLLLFTLLIFLIAIAAATPIEAPMTATTYLIHTENDPEGIEVEVIGPSDPATWGSSLDLKTEESEWDDVRQQDDTNPEPGSLYPYWTVVKE